MNELELEDAKGVLDWQHWAPPVTLTLMGFAFLAAFWHEELSAKLFIVVLFAAPSALFWLLFLRNKQRVQRDVDARMIEIVDGSPDKVWRNRFGMCFVSLAGKKIRVPAEYYDELQAATSVTLEYVPESFIALRIKPHRGLHLQ